MKIPEEVKSHWKAYLKYSTMGLEMGLSVFVGYSIGMWLDEKWGTTPWMLIFWFFCGLAAAFRPIVRLVLEFRNKKQDL